MSQTQTTGNETDRIDEPTDRTLERHWIVVLAEYWRQTDFEQYGTQKKSYADTFGERVRRATRAGDVHGALSRLAKGLGMTVPGLPTADLAPLVANDERAMQVFRREEIWLVNKADETVRNYFEAREDANREPEPTTSHLSDFVTTED